jgi:hypothetical protein
MRFLCKHDFQYSLVIFHVLFCVWLAIGPVPLIPTATARAENQAAENQATVKTEPQPRLVFPEIKHDFGTVMEGVEIKHDFIIENKGKGPLKIHGVRPG